MGEFEHKIGIINGEFEPAVGINLENIGEPDSPEEEIKDDPVTNRSLGEEFDLDHLELTINTLNGSFRLVDQHQDD